MNDARYHISQATTVGTLSRIFIPRAALSDLLGFGCFLPSLLLLRVT